MGINFWMQESGWKFAEVEAGCKKDSSKRQVYFGCRIPKCVTNWRCHLTLTSHVRRGVENRELPVCLDKDSVRSCWSGQLQEPGEHCITPVPGPQAQNLWVTLVWMAPRYVDFWKSPKMTLTCSQEWAPWLTYKLTIVPKGNRLLF